MSPLTVQKAMGKLMKNKTSFIIAHRLSTVVNADKIVVFDEGELVQTGDHKSLLEQNGLYRRLYDKEFFKEEK
jgi:ABC-type multidrug transport system fused ATPase/permease subunit